MEATDAEIIRAARALFNRHWLDVQRVHVTAKRGTVRITGELVRLGQKKMAADDPARPEVIELELKRLPGVKRVHIEVRNWIRVEGGTYIQIDNLVKGRLVLRRPSGKAEASEHEADED
jgi:hypothetical protein